MKKYSISKQYVSGLILAVALLLQPAGVFSQKRTVSTSSTYSVSKKDNGKSTIHIKDNSKDFKIEYEGEITLSDDDRDITAITRGGFIEITKSSFGNRRRLLIESDNSGNLIRKFYVGSSERNYNTDGKQWLAEILPEVVRTTGIGAESRVNRFYKKGGVNGVLNEIGNMESDHVKSAYFQLLLKKNLSNKELVNVIEETGNEIDSDHYLTEILKSNQKAFLANSQTISAYIDACKSIESDHYLTSVLKRVINDSSITDSQMESLLDISMQVESDHYLTEILTEIMDNRDLNSSNISKIIGLSKDIESDHYKTEVLKKVIKDKAIPSNAYDALLTTMDDIESDHYITEVVKELMRGKLKPTSGGLSKLLTMVSTHVQSDHYAATIYKMLAREDLSEDQLITALKSSTSINSDHYLSEVLVSFSSKVRRSSERVKAAYRTAAKSINSDSYYGFAAKAID